MQFSNAHQVESSAVTASIIQAVTPTEDALRQWLDSAEAGSRFLYHLGHLGADRAQQGSQLPAAARQALGRIADLVMDLVGDGRLLAVQKRVADRFAYLAIKPASQSNRETR